MARARPLRARAAPALLITLLATALPAGPTSAAESEEGMPEVGVKMWRKEWSWTVLDPSGLALGGGGLDESDVADLKARGFQAILNYRGEYPQEKEIVEAAGLEYMFINSTFAEADMMPVEEVEAAVAFIEENLAAGRPVYVHCTGGLHRSLVGPAAYFMKTRGWRADEALAHVETLRPSVMPWFTEALLLYEQHLYGGRKLTIDLTTTRSDLARGEEVPVTALVTENGVPVPGARVVFGAETTGKEQTGVTDKEGRVVFPFKSEDKRSLQFVYATATTEGTIAGYDRNAFWVDRAKDDGATLLEVSEPPPVEPGAEFTLHVRVREEGGGATNARIAVTTPCTTYHREFTGWDGRENITLRAPEREGTYTLRVTAVRFPAPPVVRDIPLVVGRGGPEVACNEPDEPLAPPTPVATPPPTADAGRGPTPDLAPEASVREVPAPALPALLAGLCALALARRRTG